MTPISSSPNRGYTDYQRLSNYDSGVLFSVKNAVDNPAVESDLIDVSRYAYLSMYVTPLTLNHSLELVWYLDDSFTIITGQRDFQLTPSINTPLMQTVANLGPFLQVALGTLGTGNGTVSGDWYASNRVAPIETPIGSGLLIDQQGVALAASGINTVYPNAYYSGPVNIWVQTALDAVTVSLQYLNPQGNWDYIQSFNVAAQSDEDFTWLVPIGAWRVLVVNQAASATNYYLTVLPTATGAT